jgi:uncharacterized MAPEG superfamily protein
MTTLLPSFLGLDPHARPPSLAANYIIFHFLFAYAGISTRPWKIHHGLDHDVSPRRDLALYGARAVAAGSLTQRRLDQMYRVEAAHANSVEHFPVFVAAMLGAHVAGLEPAAVNAYALVYTLARLVYVAAYVGIAESRWSRVRGVAWWVGNVVCLRAIWMGGKVWNEKLGAF